MLDLHSSWVKLLALAAHLVLNMVAASVFCVQSVCLMMGVFFCIDHISRGASSSTLSSAPRVLFDARPVRQDESTSTMSHSVFYCVEKFPVCCWFVCGVVSLCASLQQHDDGPHADAAPRFLSYFQQRSENE